MIIIDDQKPFKINNFTIIYTSYIFTDQYKQLSLTNINKTCNENLNKCDGDCLDTICCTWRSIISFSFDAPTKDTALVF